MRPSYPPTPTTTVKEVGERLAAVRDVPIRECAGYTGGHADVDCGYACLASYLSLGGGVFCFLFFCCFLPVSLGVAGWWDEVEWSRVKLELEWSGVG